MNKAFIPLILSFSGLHAGAALLISQVNSPPRNRIDFTGTIGVEFVVGDFPLSVTNLGVEDVQGDGLQQSHQVGVWDASGALLTAITVPAGTTADLQDLWRFESLANPVLLEANTRYFLGASRQSGLEIYSDNGLTTGAFSLSSDVVPVANGLLAGSFGAPSERQEGQVPRWGFANMIFNIIDPLPPIVDLKNYYESDSNENLTVDATPVSGYPTGFEYQWYFNEFAIPAAFGGAESSVTLTGVAADEGSWRVVVTNAEGFTEHAFEYRVFSDFDGDGLSDGRETLVIGSDPDLIDTDSDGLSDLLEWRDYRTNPLASDTDGDGFNDFFEINTGFDPTLHSSTPEALSEILIAVEFRFSAAEGVNYRIESSTDLENWSVVERGIRGSGGQITRFYSTQATPKRHFRARRE